MEKQVCPSMCRALGNLLVIGTAPRLLQSRHFRHVAGTVCLPTPAPLAPWVALASEAAQENLLRSRLDCEQRFPITGEEYLAHATPLPPKGQHAGTSSTSMRSTSF